MPGVGVVKVDQDFIDVWCVYLEGALGNGSGDRFDVVLELNNAALLRCYYFQ